MRVASFHIGLITHLARSSHGFSFILVCYEVMGRKRAPLLSIGLCQFKDLSILILLFVDSFLSVISVVHYASLGLTSELFTMSYAGKAPLVPVCSK